MDEKEILKLAEIMHKNTVHETLDIVLDHASKEKVTVSMQVTPKVHQPAGLLHGGVSVVLAESAASMAGAINAPEGKTVVGVEINASHLKAIRSGLVRAIATPVKIGKTLQVWNVDLVDEKDILFCKVRCTLAVIDGV
jgi:1,4-dihydroxy-2-naphthoyl-CoA hydrolase